MNINHFSSPQLLSGNVILNQAAAGTVVNGVTTPVFGTINLDTMASRSRRWFLADSFRIQASPLLSSVEAPALFSALFTPAVSVKLSAYRTALTRDYTSTRLLGPSTFEASTTSFSDSVRQGTKYFAAEQNYRWIFPRPFLIPPGDAFNVQVKLDFVPISLFGPFPPQDVSIDVSVAVSGKMVGEDEARRLYSGKNPLPYVTSFETPFPNTLAIPLAPIAVVSSNLELANPFTRPLFVQRMIGANTSVLSGQSGLNLPFDVAISDTRTIVADTQPFVNLFSPQCSAWTFKRVLQPTEYLKAKLTPLTQNPAQSQSLS